MSAVLVAGSASGAPQTVAAGAMAVAALTAEHRLALSRERLRRAMHASSAPAGAASNQRFGASSAAWPGSLKAIPGAGVIIEALAGWWARHPLRVACMVAADAAKNVIQPMAQRHPLALMLGALLVGGLLARSRPWRWILKPALFAGLLPQLVSKAMAQVPAQSWMTVLMSLAQTQRSPPRTSAG